MKKRSPDDLVETVMERIRALESEDVSSFVFQALGIVERLNQPDTRLHLDFALRTCCAIIDRAEDRDGIKEAALSAHYCLAVSCLKIGRPELTIQILQGLLNDQRYASTYEDQDLAIANHYIAGAYMDVRNLEAAERHVNKVLSLDVGANSIANESSCRHRLGWIRRQQRRFDEAEAEYRAALAIVKKRLGPTHSQSLVMSGDLADTLSRKEDWLAAEKMLSECITVLEAKGEEGRSDLAHILGRLGSHYARCGRFQDALDATVRAEETAVPSDLKRIHEAPQRDHLMTCLRVLINPDTHHEGDVRTAVQYINSLLVANLSAESLLPSKRSNQ